MNSILTSVVLVTFIVVGANAVFHIRSNRQLIFYHDQIESMTYTAGEEFCKSIGGQYPKLESQQDVDELSEFVLKHYKKYTGFWIPLKEDAQGTFIWTDGSRYDTSVAKRVIEPGNDCKGPKCHFFFSTRKKVILSDTSETAQTSVMCVISHFTVSPGGFEKGRKEFESLEKEIVALDTKVEMNDFKIKQHVNGLFEMGKSTRGSLQGIRETVKKLRSQLSA